MPNVNSPAASLGTQRDLPYFAGRKAELAALTERLERLCATGDPRGGMSLVTGVPGVGKTQLGRKFAELAAAGSRAPTVSHLAVNTSLLESDVDLFMAIARTLDADKIGRELAELDSRRDFGVGWLKAGRAREHATHAGSLFSLLLASSRTAMWRGAALLLTIDELQTVAPSGLRALRVLHEGDHGCPVLVVGIGLQHTPAVLVGAAEAPGISRFAQLIHLRPLPPEDALDAIAGTCARSATRYRQPARKRSPRRRKGSRNTSTAIWRRRCAPLTSTAVWAKARRCGRWRPAIKPERTTTMAACACCEASRPCGRWRALEQRPAKSLATQDAVSTLDAAGFSGREAIDKAIVHGVLSEDRPGAVSFGIPSFHGYVIALDEAGL